MRVSVQTPVSAVALASAAILAGSAASAAISTERQQYRPKKAAGENREPSEAGAVKACPAADPPRPWGEAPQGGGANKLPEAAQ
jgi:hypothetical protein